MPRNEEAGATEEATVSWQEKIMSQREIELYGDVINCNTVRERHYHEYVTFNKLKFFSQRVRNEAFAC